MTNNKQVIQKIRHCVSIIQASLKNYGPDKLKRVVNKQITKIGLDIMASAKGATDVKSPKNVDTEYTIVNKHVYPIFGFKHSIKSGREKMSIEIKEGYLDDCFNLLNYYFDIGLMEAVKATIYIVDCACLDLSHKTKHHKYANVSFAECEARFDNTINKGNQYQLLNIRTFVKYPKSKLKYGTNANLIQSHSNEITTKNNCCMITYVPKALVSNQFNHLANKVHKEYWNNIARISIALTVGDDGQIIIDPKQINDIPRIYRPIYKITAFIYLLNFYLKSQISLTKLIQKIMKKQGIKKDIREAKRAGSESISTYKHYSSLLTSSCYDKYTSKQLGTCLTCTFMFKHDLNSKSPLSLSCNDTTKNILRYGFRKAKRKLVYKIGPSFSIGFIESLKKQYDN